MSPLTINQTHAGNGNNIIEIAITMDVGRLNSIVQTEGERIKEIFNSMSEKKQNHIGYTQDDSSVSIFQKNVDNELVEYWDKFIVQHESKLEVLFRFFDENDYSTKIEIASQDLKEEIFAYKNKKDDVLYPELLRVIINQHTAKLLNDEDKEIAKLIIFYLYRYCFIGAKNDAI